MKGSDPHLKVGAPPAVRVHGGLEHLEGYEVLRPADTDGILKEIIPQKLIVEIEEDGEADFSYAVSGVGRFRANAFRERGSTSINDAVHPVRGAEVRGPRAAGGHREAGALGARHNSRYGYYGEREVHDARIKAQPRQTHGG